MALADSFESTWIFSTPELFRLYKAQVLSYLESGTPALFHAAATVLDRVDRVQRRFLRERGFTELSALKNFRLAPLNARRDMAMLGALHKVNLGTAPPQLRSLFPPSLGPRSMRGGWTLDLRRIRPPHSKQLLTAATFESTNVLQRSLFGLVHLYNKLPQHVVGSPSVCSFQKSAE